MPRDKTQSHSRIIEAAKREFLKYGYADSSLRRIADAAGIQVSGLYKHFASKEEMFASLVDPVIEGFMECFRGIEKGYYDELNDIDPAHLWEEQTEIVRAMAYIYDHIDVFRLIICKSQGTKYEGFLHDIATLEEDVTVSYMKELEKRGYAVKEVGEKEFHLLVTASVDAIFQAVVHDFTRDEAMHYAQTLNCFYLPAWKALFGV